MSDRARIFCIGLNKTGTSSLHAALELLGIKSLHWGGEETMLRMFASIDAGEPMLARLDPDVDAFSDIFPIANLFYLADVQYPGSRFILTVRDLDDWLDSRRRHVERNRSDARAGRYDGSFLRVDLDGWRTEYTRHEAVVRAYFHGRPDDLLVYDIAGGDGWDPLCAFLERPVPDVSFPWINRTPHVELR